MDDETTECSVDGCIREATHHTDSDRPYCSECLNDMQHAALDLAGVP